MRSFFKGCSVLYYHYFLFEGICLWFKRLLITVSGSDESRVICLCSCLWYSQSDFFWLWTGQLFSGLTRSSFDVSWRASLWSTVSSPGLFSFGLRWIVLFGSGSRNRPHLRKHAGRSTNITPSTTILRAHTELSPTQQTACKVLTVEVIPGEVDTVYRRSSLGTHKVLYSAYAETLPTESNDRSINLTTHKYGAKIVNVQISAVLPLYKFMAWRSKRGYRTVLTFRVKLNATFPHIF
jgi:hypothetical protein